MKYEWRKRDKLVYLPKGIQVIEVPEYNFITIEGEGTPGDERFSECVGALYAISYALKMNLKNKEGFYDYTVFPLEGEWDFNQEGRRLYQQGVPVVELKHLMRYKLVIRQPEFVDLDLFKYYQKLTFEKKKSAVLNEVKFEQVKEGLSCTTIHIGSYDDEPATFNEMEQFSLNNGFARTGKMHKEIYITDPSRVTPEKLKTTLRFKVKSK